MPQHFTVEQGKVKQQNGRSERYKLRFRYNEPLSAPTLYPCVCVVRISRTPYEISSNFI